MIKTDPSLAFLQLRIVARLSDSSMQRQQRSTDDRREKEEASRVRHEVDQVSGKLSGGSGVTTEKMEHSGT